MSLASEEIARRLTVATRVMAAGGTLRQAASELGMDDSALSRFLTARGIRFGKPSPPRFDYDAIFATAKAHETSYHIAKRIGGDPSDVRKAAKLRGVILAAPSVVARGIKWDNVLADAEVRGLRVFEVALEQDCSPESVKGALRTRGLKLAGQRGAGSL